MTHEFDLGVLLAGPCLAALLVCLSKTLRYYLKFFVYLSVVSILAIVVMPIFAARPKNVINLV